MHRPLKTSILRAGEIHIFGFNWKPTSAVVLHRPPPPTEIGDPGSLKRSHIISDALPRQMNQAQQALMQEINIPFLYLYDTYFLSEPWIFKRDYRHYQDGISALLLIYYWPGQNQTCLCKGTRNFMFRLRMPPMNDFAFVEENESAGLRQKVGHCRKRRANLILKMKTTRSWA